MHAKQDIKDIERIFKSEILHAKLRNRNNVEIMRRRERGA
jgi:hypothetical protein